MMAMEKDVEAEDDIEEDHLLLLHRDLCMGCHRKGMNGDACDDSLHTRSTRTCRHMSAEDLAEVAFVCSVCCPIH